MDRPLSSPGVKPAATEKEKVTFPPQYRVLMHNDDYTTMEFVVASLETVFHKTPTEANRIMLHIHLKGVGECGIYPFEIAETKVARVHAMARKEGFPLRCSLEKV